MPRTYKRINDWLIPFWALLLFPCLAWGQVTNVTNETSTPIPGAGHDYIKMVSETVNPANGSVSLRIGVPVPPGRGLTLPFSFNLFSRDGCVVTRIRSKRLLFYERDDSSIWHYRQHY